MPIALVLLPIAALAVLVMVSRSAQAVQAPAPIGGAGDPAAADPGALVLPAEVSPVVETLRALGDTVTAAARKLFSLPPAAEPYREAIAAAEAKHGIPETLLARLLYQESRYREDIITGKTASSAGALGIAQFMPATAAELGIDPLEPGQAIDGAALYLRRLYDQLGDWAAALAAYNWGIGNVKKKGVVNAPTETRLYITQILSDVEV